MGVTALANVNVLETLELMRQQLAQAKQALEQNQKTQFQTLMTALAANKTIVDAAVSAQTNINVLQGLV